MINSVYTLAISTHSLDLYRVINSETLEVVSVDLPFSLALTILEQKRAEDVKLSKMFGEVA